MDNLTAFAARADCEPLSPPVHGGSASVCRARCRRRDAIVALKVLHPGRDPERLRREARTLDGLAHPSIVEPVRSGDVDGVPYLLTAWVDGVPLRRLLDPDGPAPGLSLERSLRLLAPILDALDHAHARRTVHGDLTPANVLVTPTDRIVLIDFGGGLGADDVTLTAREDLAGTPRYLAPELIRGASPSPASDRYAAALLGYEMLSGRWPFTRRAPVAAAALHHQLYTAPTPLSEHRPDLPAALDGVFERALAKSPDDRHPSPAAFREDLLRASRRQMGGAGVARPARAPSVPAPDDARGRTSAVPLPGPRRGRRAATRLGALCLCVAGLAPSVGGLMSADVREPPDACNRYPNAGFDAALEPNFYRDADNPDPAIRTRARTGHAAPALQLGNVDVYGLYGVIVPVEGGRDYRLEASLAFEGYVHRMELQVLWLDADWQTIEGAISKLEITERDDAGRHALLPATAPAHARHAVPTLYKDASAGTVYADDVVFAPASGGCDESSAEPSS